MKKRHLLILLSALLYTHAFSRDTLPQNRVTESFYKHFLEDNKGWKKTKEQNDGNGKFYHLEFISQENPKERITVAFEERKIELSDDQDKRYYLSSLFQREHAPSALQRMKELRLESKKQSCPYSVWKLLYVFDQDDIIYEYRVSKPGPYEPYYEITRLIKQEGGYLRIAYTTQEETHSKSSQYLNWLKNCL